MRGILQIALIIFLSSFSFQLNAQTVKWGVEAKTDKAKGSVYSLGWHNGFLYNIEEESGSAYVVGGKIKLEKLSENMKPVLSKKLEIGMNDYLSHQTLFKIIGNHLVLYSISHSSKKGGIVSSRIFDLEGNLKETKKIGTIPTVSTFNGYGSSFRFIKSRDEKLVTLVSTNYNRKGNRIRVNVTKIDDSDSIIAQYDELIRVKNQISYQSLKNVKVDLRGNTVINIATRSTEHPTNEYLLVFTENGLILKNEILQLNDFLFKEVNIKMADNGEMYFVSHLVRELEEEMLKVGFLFAQFNTETYELENSHVFPYSEEFFNKLGYKIDKDGTVDFTGTYDLRMILNKTAGGYLIANHNTGYGNREILVFHFDKEFTISEPIVVPRAITSYPPLLNGLDYVSFLRQEKLHLVYTDHKDNIHIEEVAELEKLDNPKDKKAALFMAVIEGDKEATRKIILEKNAINGYLIPGKSKTEDDKIILNFGNRKRPYMVN